MLKRKDLLGLKDLTLEEMDEIFSVAREMHEIIESDVKKSDHLKGKNVINLFYENSTRTRTSFETAAKIMSANAINISVSTSSVSKGETLIDTGKNLEALGADIIVIRHSMAGAPHLLSRNVHSSVINAGDGQNEHPTQALLDIYTMIEKFGNLKGLKVVIAGDIKHSRVARSNIWGLKKYGAIVTVCAPKTLLPCGIEDMDVNVSENLDSCIDGANVLMGLRLQLERQQAGLFPSVAEYNALYGINRERLLRADADAIVMHPGPVNRGTELDCDVADCEQSYILRQVTNGLAVRMAIMKLLMSKK